MNPFEYKRAEQEQAAIDAIISGKDGGKDAKFLAGGTNLIDLMKNGVQTPSRLVDINRVPLTEH